MVEFKSKLFTAEQIKKIDDGMKLLLQKGKELDELKIVVKKLNKELETKEKQIELLKEQIQTYKDKEDIQEIDDEEFNSFYNYFFTKQEKV